MFARSISISKESTSNNINLNSDEFFEAINKGDIEKVKTYSMVSVNFILMGVRWDVEFV